MNNQVRVAILAVPVAIVVALANLHYINDKVGAQTKMIRERYEEVHILVAARNLPRGHVIEAGDLKALARPSIALHADVLYPNDAERIIGWQLSHAIERWDPLLEVHVAKSRSDGFSDRVAAGKRAIGFPVDIISSVNGMLRPGDRIDLLSTLRDGDTAKTVTLVANVSVMATGQRADELNLQEAGGRFQTITLELDIEDAHRIEHAQRTGRLAVALRSPDDEQPGYAEAVTDERLLRPWRSTLQRRRGVEIIRGNRL